MLPGNVDSEVRKILQKKGRAGWLRVEECVKEYARDPKTGKVNGTRRTRFYRWRKQVEKDKVKGFQVLHLPHNVAFIGLESADPSAIDLGKLAIAKVSIERCNVVMANDTTFTIKLSLRNKLKTPTTIEEVHIETDGRPVTEEMEKDIPSGATRQIKIPSFGKLFGRTWKEGGRIKFKVVHTYGTESLDFVVPSLYDKSLPFYLFSCD